MIASHVSAEVLQSAALAVGVAVDITTLNAKNTRHRVKVNSAPTAENYRTATARDGRTYQVRYQDERGDAPWQRESVGYSSAGRRVSAVCWHGFQALFRAVYETTPSAVFRTSVDTWRGSEDFEARHRDTAGRNIGPRISPVAMVEACRCEWRGTSGPFVPSYRETAVAVRASREVLETTPETGVESGDGDTSCFERPDGVPAVSWAEYNRRFNAMLGGAK